MGTSYAFAEASAFGAADSDIPCLEPETRNSILAAIFASGRYWKYLRGAPVRDPEFLLRSSWRLGLGSMRYAAGWDRRIVPPPLSEACVTPGLTHTQA